jgi:hypothetical protein
MQNKTINKFTKIIKNKNIKIKISDLIDHHH